MTEAIWALVGIIIGSTLTAIFSRWQQKKQFDHEKSMFQLQNKSKEVVKEILEDALSHKIHVIRSLDTLKKRIGGYTDDEIKKLLHEIGAIRTTIKSDGREGWYLKERKEELPS
jgi:hypothetical protein